MSIQQGKRVLEIEARAIAALVDRLDERFAKAVDLLHRCPGKVVVSGMGKSGLIGQKIAATLASTGTPAFFVHPADGIHGDLGMLAKQDALLAISNSGETEEVIKLLPFMKRLNIPIISLTGRTQSTLAKNSDVVLDVSVSEEACPLGLAPTSSTTAALAMGDAVAIALLQKRGFKEEDFAQFHPGGALGRRLLFKVRDLMHQGDALPRISATAAARDAIREITAKKLGMTTVVNAKGQLVGVITDGDLRRFLERGNSLAKAKAKDLGSKSPRTIQADALAAKALQTMEQFSITSIVVVDERNRLSGVIHLHDLLKNGVV
ncbi:MAG: D-arabinose 5-phosphate isomerase [Nitrospirae bacterium RIFCSPLOWO2_12_FULL_63_8]|nr:MAG: D-arabinose 5-phosphate isomerase [Nitrospirae bacterium RIFCSPLOWO2_12_FULL_63_8]